MKNSRPVKIYQFGEFRLDATHLLLYQNECEMTFTPKIVETLLALVERSGEVLSKDELMEIIWADTIVEESNLSQNLYLLRKIFKDTTAHGKPLIETLKRRGYRFNGDVREISAAENNQNENQIVVEEDFSHLEELIGRRREISEIKKLLRQSDVRLVTLAGVGGMGKTRIAQALMKEMREEFADGAAFVELAAITNPKFVVSTIFQSLGLKESGNKPILEILKNYLRTREMLLVIDNFEQVAAAATDIAELLSAAKEIKILITSRVLLRLSSEREFIVPPLALPEENRNYSSGEIESYSAVKLFIERARLVKPDFALTAENASDTAKICARLDGLPLAIELAAARVKLLSPSALLKRLEHRLQILHSSEKKTDQPVRRQTMRGAIAWSCDLLDAGEKSLFNKLSVFSGGFTVEAAEAVCGDTEDTKVLDSLEILVGSSLLHQTTDENGDLRLSMLETIKEYGAENLAENAEAACDMHHRHATFFLTFACKTVADLYGARQSAQFNRLQSELDNFRAALDWNAQTDNADELALSAALSPFWNFRGYLTEGSDRLRQALARVNAPAPEVKAAALVALGEVIWFAGDYPLAIEQCEKSLALARCIKHQRVCARSLFILGMSHWYQYGDGDRATAFLEEGLTFYRELNFDTGITLTLVVLAAIRQSKNDLAQAEILLDESLTAAERAENDLALSIALVNYGRLKFAQGDFKRAEDLCRRSLKLRGKILDRWGLVQCLAPLAAISVVKDEPRRAAVLHGGINALLESVGAQPPPIFRTDFESSLAATRTAIGEKAFAGSFAAGQKLPLEEIIKFALSPNAETKSAAEIR